MQPTITTYTFPINLHEDLFFSTTGAYVQKAILSVGNTKLSIFKTDIDAKLNEIDFNQFMDNCNNPPETNLAFFDDKPFRGKLAAEWRGVTVTVYSIKGVPTLNLRAAEQSLSWESIPGDHYAEEVTTYSDAGKVTKTLIYRRDRGGFRRN
jgi:hypothetical protein